jgi:hypothetical protein
MHGFYIEKRQLPIGISLSKDLAQHIFTRAAHGPVVVVAAKPQDLASVTKKQWHALIRLVQRERSSTLRAARIAEISNQIGWMQQLTFTAKPNVELADGCVSFVAVNEALVRPPICSALYITSTISGEQLHLITSWLPKNSVVVLYESLI